MERLKTLTEEKKAEYQKAEASEQKRFHQTMGDVTHQVCLNELKLKIIIATTAFQLADAIQNIIKNKDLSKEEYDAYMGVIAVTEIAILDLSFKTTSTLERIDEYSKNPILKEGIQDHLKTLKGGLNVVFGFGLMAAGVASGGFLGLLVSSVGVAYIFSGIHTLLNNVNSITVPANYLADLHEKLGMLPSPSS